MIKTDIVAFDTAHMLYSVRNKFPACFEDLSGFTLLDFGFEGRAYELASLDIYDLVDGY